MALIARAPWREAVTYRDTWPHEYVIVKKDSQQDLLAAFCARIARGEGVEGRFFGQTRQYLFLGKYKYWTMTDCSGIDLDIDDYVLNRAPLYHDRRDFMIQQGDTGVHEGHTGLTVPEEGIEQLEVRTMWEHEALDFTPWLAANLHLLGQEINMQLELIQQEKPIGPLFLDILAREADTGAIVAIENQLEWTDIGHLGQLLTYMTGCDAQMAIWVATEFRHEHAKALNRLNEWTNTRIRFYGVKVEVVRRNGDPHPQARFRKVVYPGGWNRDFILPLDPPVPAYVQKYHDFFLPLAAKLIRMGLADRHRQYFGHTGRFFPSRHNRDVGYAVSLERNKDAWVTFHIQITSTELTKRIFDELQAQREPIQSSVDAGPDPKWHWLRYDQYTFSCIGIRRNGSINDSPEILGEIEEWMLDLLPKFKETLDPRLAKILSELSMGSGQ